MRPQRPPPVSVGSQSERGAPRALIIADGGAAVLPAALAKNTVAPTAPLAALGKAEAASAVQPRLTDCPPCAAPTQVPKVETAGTVPAPTSPTGKNDGEGDGGRSGDSGGDHDSRSLTAKGSVATPKVIRDSWFDTIVVRSFNAFGAAFGVTDGLSVFAVVAAAHSVQMSARKA